MKSILTSTLAALALALATPAAQAQSNWYFLIGAAPSYTKAAQDRAANDATLAAQGFVVSASQEEFGATSLALGAGYRFSRHLSIEVASLDFSRLHDYIATYQTGSNSGSLSKRWRASGLEVAAVGSWPLSDSFALIAKAGVLAMRGKYSTATRVVSPPPTITVLSDTESSASGSATVPGIGLGVSYTIDREFTVRAMYEGWSTKSGTFGPGNDLDRIRQFSLSLLYRL